MKHIVLFVATLFVLMPAESLFAKQSLVETRLFLPDLILRPALSPDIRQPAIDTLHLTAGQQAKITKINPRKATIRSLILPGWGQFYNRQYWKIPVIYAGLGVAIGFYSWNNARYGQYLAGYREAYNAPTSEKTAIVRGELRSVDQLKRFSDQFRRQRDLTIILTVVGWALNAVEANVAAHLKTFDISDDISMRIGPTVLPGMGLGRVPGIRVTFVY